MDIVLHVIQLSQISSPRLREEPTEEVFSSVVSDPGIKRQKVGGKIDIADRVCCKLARIYSQTEPVPASHRLLRPAYHGETRVETSFQVQPRPAYESGSSGQLQVQ